MGWIAADRNCIDRLTAIRRYSDGVEKSLGLWTCSLTTFGLFTRDQRFAEKYQSLQLQLSLLSVWDNQDRGSASALSHFPHRHPLQCFPYLRSDNSPNPCQLEVCILKFDAGSEEIYQRYHQPAVDIRLQDLVTQLKSMVNITLQSLFTGGERGNFTTRHLERWARKVNEIQPRHVQLYTLSRGYPSRKIHPLTAENLLDIKAKT